MPVLKNAKHEKFAQGLAKGLGVGEAYKKAGYKPSRAAASRLSTNVNVQARLEELQGRAAKKAVVTVESIAQELEEARSLALSEKQTSAAVSASMGKAKLFGLGVEKRHLTGTLQLVNITHEMIEALSPDERSIFKTAIPVLDKLGFFAGNAGRSGAEGGSEQEA